MEKFNIKISVNEMKTATFKGKQFARYETVVRIKKTNAMRRNLIIYKISS
jgi:hypothetical protein